MSMPGGDYTGSQKKTSLDSSQQTEQNESQLDDTFEVKPEDEIKDEDK